MSAALGQGDRSLPMRQEFGDSGWLGDARKPKHMPDICKVRHQKMA